jgi:prevent-host-death family protein
VSQINVGISEFRANMRSFLEQVREGAVIRLLNRGEEVARLVPPDYAQTAARKELESLRETAVVGDVLSPIDETWSASE